MATKKTTEEVIEIRPIDIRTAQLRIVGDTPLIVHAWSEKAKKMMSNALKELIAFQRKYARLSALKPVFDAIDNLPKDGE